MITYESPLRKLKNDILKAVISLTDEDKVNEYEINRVTYKVVPSTKPQYRCCVYHERAIVREGARLAAGFIPNGEDSNHKLEPLKGNQILYVIPSACDRCPIDKYRVTENCRGCLKHKCMEVCPAGAITRINGQAYIEQDLCRECGLCSKSCPYHAISEISRPCMVACPTNALDINSEDRKAVIKNEDCINCGACMEACPFGAISDRSYIVDIVKALNAQKQVFAVVAPAITGQFGNITSVGKIKSALLNAGFADMFEAACSADAVTVHEGNEFAEKMELGQTYMTNSCCPGFVNYIEKSFPTEVEKISSTVSPMIAAGRYIKKNNPDALVVFIGPCTAKKYEATRESIKDAVDYVMTFEEITALFDVRDIDPEECEELSVDEASLFGRGFGQGGGLTAAVENYVADKGLDVDFKFKPIKVSGKDELKKTMMLAKTNKLGCNFIEGMMCSGGCIGGPATMVSIQKSKPQLVKFGNAASKKTVLSNEKIKEFESVNLHR